MNEPLKKHLREVLKNGIRAYYRFDLVTLRELSNPVLNKDSIYQENESISLTLVLYAVSKIAEKNEGTKGSSFDAFYKHSLGLLKRAYKSLEQENEKIYYASIKKLFQLILNFDKKSGSYIQDVLETTKIKKGSAMYNQGISLGRVAELFHVSKWDLVPYIGNIKEEYHEEKLKDRIMHGRFIFGLK